jgi:hypothetical protein
MTRGEVDAVSAEAAVDLLRRRSLWVEFGRNEFVEHRQLDCVDALGDVFTDGLSLGVLAGSDCGPDESCCGCDCGCDSVFKFDFF